MRRRAVVFPHLRDAGAGGAGAGVGGTASCAAALLLTFHLCAAASRDAILSGKYANIRVHGMEGNSASLLLLVLLVLLLLALTRRQPVAAAGRHAASFPLPLAVSFSLAPSL